MFSTLREARAITGGLSEPSKMPGYAYNLPAQACSVGSKLRQVEGSVCSKCYALKGRYVFGIVKKAMQRRLEAIHNPLWVEAMAFEIAYHAHRDPTGRCQYFRWHDSGDLQGMWHLEKINEVCKKTSDVHHWLPTREIGLVQRWLKERGAFAPNLVVRVSAPMIGQEIIGIPGVPISTVGRSGFGVQCKAREQGGQCNECRACWSSANINYPLH